MGCCGDREKGLIVSDEQKWDYIVRCWNAGRLNSR